MPILLRHNPKLEISRVEYFGAIRGADMHNHATFNAENPVWLGFDCISVIHADVDVSDISLIDLDGAFRTHRQLFEPLNLMFMRRSAGSAKARSASVTSAIGWKSVTPTKARGPMCASSTPSTPRASGLCWGPKMQSR